MCVPLVAIPFTPPAIYITVAPHTLFPPCVRCYQRQRHLHAERRPKTNVKIIESTSQMARMRVCVYVCVCAKGLGQETARDRGRLCHMCVCVLAAVGAFIEYAKT